MKPYAPRRSVSFFLLYKLSVIENADGFLQQSLQSLKTLC